MFPRLQKRGPIEAHPLAGPGSNLGSFHAYKSVAPLKQRNRQSLGRCAIGFHAYKSVAPLKRALLKGLAARRA